MAKREVKKDQKKPVKVNRNRTPRGLDVKIEELRDMTRDKLYALSVRIDLCNRSIMKKEELCDALTQYLLSQEKMMEADYLEEESPALSTTSSSRPSEQSRPIYIDLGAPIPDFYHTDRIVAMVRDPYWLFIYWELEGEKRREIASKYGRDIFSRSRWIIRAEFIDENIREDIPVMPEYKNWYLRVNPNGRYQIKIGILTSDNIFISLAASEVVKTPSAVVSDVVDDHWSIDDEKYRQIMKSVGLEPTRDGWTSSPSSPRHWSPSFAKKDNSDIISA